MCLTAGSRLGECEDYAINNMFRSSGIWHYYRHMFVDVEAWYLYIDCVWTDRGSKGFLDYSEYVYLWFIGLAVSWCSRLLNVFNFALQFFANFVNTTFWIFSYRFVGNFFAGCGSLDWCWPFPGIVMRVFHIQWYSIISLIAFLILWNQSIASVCLSHYLGGVLYH